MDSKIYDLGRREYLTAVGYFDLPKDDDGFCVLEPTASRVDEKVESLTTTIDDLESKLKKFRSEKAAAVKYQKTPEYKADKKKEKAKKNKKAKVELLSMVFNNADAVAAAEEEDDEEGYRENKKRTRKTTTLDTTYGKRFTPVVSLLHDSIRDFDRIAADIEEELKSPRCQAKTMYRSSQTSNLLTAKDKKLSAIKELAAVSTTLSNLEYKKDKDKAAAEGGDNSKMISNLGARYLQGSFDMDTGIGPNKKGKKGSKKNKKGSSNFSRSAREMGYDPDEDEEDSVKRVKSNRNNADNDSDLAKALAEQLVGRSDLHFSAHEKNLKLEGKWTPAIVCDVTDPEHTWSVIAIDPKTGKELKGFSKEYKNLLPKRKDMRLRFDISKKRASDLNSGRTYKLIFK